MNPVLNLRIHPFGLSGLDVRRCAEAADTPEGERANTHETHVHPIECPGVIGCIYGNSVIEAPGEGAPDIDKVFFRGACNLAC